MPPMPPDEPSPDGGASLPHEYKANFGRNLQAARKLLGLTQAELGARLASTQGYVSRVEAGVENLTIETMTKLAFLVGRDLRDMLDNPEAPSNQK